jgi:thiamine-phosphate pyrophosphorylase
MPIDAIRAAFPAELLIGISTHSLDEVAAASNAAVDYVYFGPVFATQDKPDPVGIELLQEACRIAGDLPIIAIGGINEQNVVDVMAAGAHGIAAIRGLNDEESRRRILRAIT